MSTKDDGGPAFPAQHSIDGNWVEFTGMTLRDWFAAMALQAINYRGSADFLADEAYRFADAMIEARKK